MREPGSPCLWREDWRPCITVPESGQEHLAYYDADLLWGASRPRVFNIARLRKHREGRTVACEPPLPALADVVDTWETLD